MFNVKNLFSKSSPEEKRKKELLSTLKKTLKYHFEYTYPLIADRLFLGGSGFAVKKIINKVGENKEFLDVIKRKFSKRDDFGNIRDLIEGIDLKKEFNRILNINDSLEDEDIINFFYNKRQTEKQVFLTSDIKSLIDEYLESIKKSNNYDMTDEEIANTFSSLKKNHLKFKNLYSILLNYKEQTIYLPKKSGSYFILQNNDYNYVFTTPKLTLRKLKTISTHIDNINKYTIVTLNVESYNKRIEEIRLFKEIDLTDLNRTSIPYLKNYLYTSLLNQGKRDSIEDFKITIPNAGRDQNNSNAILVQVKHEGTFKLVNKDQLNIVIDEDNLRNDISILGGQPKGNVSDITLNVGGSMYRGMLTSNAEGITLVIRKTDGLPLSREKVKEAAGLDDEELDEMIIRTDLVNDNIYRNLDAYESKKKEFDKQGYTYLDPLKEKEDYAFPDFYSIPYNKRLVKNFLNSFNNSRGGLYFITGPMGTWKSSTVQQLLNKLYKEKTKSDYVNYNVFTMENPVEKRNRFFTHLKVDDTVDDKQYSKMVKGLKRNNVEICFIGELRSADVYPAISDVSKSLPAIMTYHVNSIANFFTNFVDYLRRANIMVRGEIERLKLIVVHSLVQIEKGKNSGDRTNNVEYFIQELKSLFDYNPKSKKHRKIFKLLYEIGEFYMEKDNSFLLSNSSETRPKLIEENITASGVKRWLRKVDDIKDVDFSTIYDYVNLKRTLLYQVLDLICQGKITVTSLPLNDYASDIIIDVLEQFKDDKLQYNIKTK